MQVRFNLKPATVRQRALQPFGISSGRVARRRLRLAARALACPRVWWSNSARAGHANPSVKLNIYAHVLPGQQEGAAAVVDAALNAALQE